MRGALVLIGAALLAGCDDAAPEDRPVTTVDPTGRPGDPEPPPPPMLGPTEEDLAKLEIRDCRTVAEAYANAVYRRAFAYAAMFWEEDAIDAGTLATRYAGYSAPRFQIATVRELDEGASRSCTVTGALGDATDQSRPLRPGKIVLRRAAEPPGQARWTIRLLELEEEMPRGGRGEPA